MTLSDPNERHDGCRAGSLAPSYDRFPFRAFDGECTDSKRSARLVPISHVRTSGSFYGDASSRRVPVQIEVIPAHRPRHGVPNRAEQELVFSPGLSSWSLVTLLGGRPHGKANIHSLSPAVAETGVVARPSSH